LDGEKNLKKRNTPKDIETFAQQGNPSADQLIFIGECESDHPNQELYNYAGTLKIAQQVFALDINQLLLKGAVLQNTEWVIGYCVFTGHDTKIMKNSQKGHQKLSNLEKQLN
jgi:magnesium-transporting ATPase (P-type)